MAPVFPVSDGDYTGMVFVEKINQNTYRLLNNTGATINQHDYLLFNGMLGVALQEAADTEYFDFLVDDEIELHANDLVTGFDTFGTLYQTVYFNAGLGQFSDSSESGIPVGVLSQIKNSDGMIKFFNLRRTTLMEGSVQVVEYEVDEDASAGITYDPGFDFKLLDVVAVSTATVALATVTVGDGTNSITDAIDIATDTTRTPAATIDDTYSEITVASEALTFTTNSAADRCRLILTIKAV